MFHRQVEPLALVGIGCRFPGDADDPDSLWRLLVEGEDATREVPDDRWDLRRFYDPDPQVPGKMYVKRGGFIAQSIERFDAMFFGISPREAADLDPQQRILLEVTWEALGDAGFPVSSLAGSRTGVFIGSFILDHFLGHMGPLNRRLIGPYTAVGTTKTILSNRISYLLDLRGPSVSMDTACSSSLVAFHYACESIWSGTCDMALAGGVNLILQPEPMIAMCKGKFLSPDGRCKSFDSRGDGYGRGEGAGVVVLVPLSVAERNRDRIYAVVEATGVNQDGRSEGLTVPNPDSQQELIARVCDQAAIDPRNIVYFEAHGTGTRVGDPLEARSIGAVVGKRRSSADACLLGSIKANIGHLEAASGIAGVIKAALCLERAQVPPIAGLQQPHPDIPFEALGLRLPTRLEPLPEGPSPRYAGVNSFGYGGTNAVAILREHSSPPPGDEVEPDGTRRPMLVLSARNEGARADLCRAYARRIEAYDADALHDLCYSAARRRDHDDARVAVVGESAAGMADALRAFAEEGTHPACYAGTGLSEVMPLVFVFTGMGPQWWAMGRKLFEAEPAFRAEMRRGDEAFRRVAGWSILDEMLADEAASRIAETQIAQPANLLLQIALAELFRAWGIEADAVVGHSVGEVASAYWSGVLDLDDAMTVSFHRSRVQQTAAGRGSMLAVGLSQEQAQDVLEPYRAMVSIAAINSRTSVTMSGDTTALQTIAAALEADGTFNRFLKVEVPYHSPLMDPLALELRASLQTIQPRPSSTPVYSTVTSERLQGGGFDAEYWCRNVREPVHFAATVERILDDGYRVFVEVGPRPALSSYLKEAMLRRNVTGKIVSSLTAKDPEPLAIVQAVARLYAAGCAVDMARVFPKGRFTRLPRYPWQRELHWKQESPDALIDRLGANEHPLLGIRQASPKPTWESSLNAQMVPFLGDHRLEDTIVLPGAAFVEMGLAAAREIHGSQDIVLEKMAFRRALIVTGTDDPVLRLEYEPEGDQFTIYSRPRDDRDGWILHASGRVVPTEAPPEPRHDAPLRSGIEGEAVDGATFYERLSTLGYHYGPTFRNVRKLWPRGTRVLALIESEHATEGQIASPPLVDACIQSLLGIVDDAEGMLVPVGLERFRLYGGLGCRFYCHGSLSECDETGRRTADLVLFAEDGTALADVRGLELAPLGHASAVDAELLHWMYQWRWEEDIEADDANVEARSQATTWVVFTDDQGVAARVVQSLRSSGDDVVEVVYGESFSEPSASRLHVCPDDPEELVRLFVTADLPRPLRVVYLCGLDAGLRPEDVVGAQITIRELHLVQALSDHASSELTIVTRGAQRVRPAETVCVAQAPLIALLRVAATEHPRLRHRAIDVDESDASLAALSAELRSDRGLEEISLRSGVRFVHRLSRVSATPAGGLELSNAAPAPAGTPFEIEVMGHARARCRRLAPAMLADQEVDIEVHAMSLPRSRSTDPVAIGGVIAGAGAQVVGLEEGDVVVAWVPTNPRSHVRVLAEQVVKLTATATIDPARIAGFEGLLRAHCGLAMGASLRPGDVVLVRDNDANAGLAAARIAVDRGARVLAMSARDDVRQSFRDAAEIEQVFDASRLDLTAELRRATEGRGIDLLFDAGAERGPALEELMAPMGRVVLSCPSTTVQGRSLFGMTVSCVDLEGLRVARPQRFRELLARTAEARGGEGPLDRSVKTFPWSAIEDALEADDDGGAVVLTRGPAPALLVPPVRPETSWLGRGTLLVTGAFGGFGGALCTWLATHGATHLVLMGRRGATTPAARDLVLDLEARGVTVHSVALDVVDSAALHDFVERLPDTMPPVTGVFHAAGVLEDAPLREMTADRFMKAFAPKAVGAWNLHEATKELELDVFVLFSSVSTLIGNAHQSNYVAANAVLDALAHHRTHLGLPALSVNWGVIADVGMAADANVAAHLSRAGLRAIDPARALEGLGLVLREGAIQVGIADIDWGRLARFDERILGSSRLRNVTESIAATSKDHVLTSLSQMPAQERSEAVAQRIVSTISEVLDLPKERVELNQRLLGLGAESLMIMQIQAMIRSSLQVEISTMELMKARSISEIVDVVSERFVDQEEAVTNEPVDAASMDLLSRIDEFDDHEIDDILQDLLASNDAQSQDG